MNAVLQEVLTGWQSVKYGPLPKVQLPADDALLSRFAQEILEIVRMKGIYRRDNVPVLPDPVRGRLEILDAQTFRTWVERHLVCFKQKFDKDGEPFDVLRTMNKETAEGVLKCMEFRSGLVEVVSVNPVRLPSIDEETGELTLLQPGYDERTKTLTFE